MMLALTSYHCRNLWQRIDYHTTYRNMTSTLKASPALCSQVRLSALLACARRYRIILLSLFFNSIQLLFQSCHHIIWDFKWIFGKKPSHLAVRTNNSDKHDQMTIIYIMYPDKYSMMLKETYHWELCIP